MTKKQHHYFWTPEEDKYLIEMKLDGKNTKKIVRSLKKLGYAKRTNASVNTRCTILKQQYKVEDYQELLQKLQGENKSEQIQEDPLKKRFDNFYEKELSPYMKKLENASNSKEQKNCNPLEKYLANDYIVLKINKIEKKLSEEEKSQLEKILEKLENRETKKTNKTNKNKTKNYHYPLPELTPSEIRKRIIKMKKQNATNEKIYGAFNKKYSRNVSAYIAHFTMGHYHKRKLV